jgi:Lon protease-like protein
VSEIVLPIFPLPDVVHFPGTDLPLHIFEPRYRQMVDELLTLPEAERRVGMILAGRDPESGSPRLVEPGCAGRLVEHRPLEDGRSNIVLRGEFRFVLERDLPGKPYRRALVTPLEDGVAAIDADAADALERELVDLAVAVARESGPRTPFDVAGLAGLGRPGRLVGLVNRLAADLDLPVERKQMLLAEAPLGRAAEIAGILRSRMKLLTSLKPYRHLAGAAREN